MVAKSTVSRAIGRTYDIEEHWRAASGRRMVAPRSAALETLRNRLTIVAAIFITLFVAVAWRVSDLTIARDASPAPRRVAIGDPSAARIDIVDRDGALLARDVETLDIVVKPADLPDPARAAHAIASVIPEIEAGDLKARFKNPNFAYILRDATPRQASAIHALGLPKIEYRPTRQRAYPKKNLFAHVVGYVDVDNKGIAGIERSRDERLKGAQGAPLALTLDADIQYAVHEELSAGLVDYGAKAAIGIVLAVDSGEIVALVSLPDFDPHRPGDHSAEAQRNRATANLFEMGSTFKPFTFAAGFEAGVFGLGDSFDASKPLVIARKVIRDYRPKNRWLSTSEVFLFSSNIGTSRMTLLIGPERQRAFLSSIGMLDPSPIEVGEVAMPLIQRQWGEIEAATISYGYGLLVSPMQLASGLAALVNGGRYMPPTLLQEREPERPTGHRVVSTATSDKIRMLMRANVIKGTGTGADVPGYEVGGKTGTANKRTNGAYDASRQLASFAAIFPARAPDYLLLVMLDEPTRVPDRPELDPTGGATAAPLSGRIIRRIAPMMDMAPLPAEERWQTVSYRQGG